MDNRHIAAVLLEVDARRYSWVPNMFFFSPDMVVCKVIDTIIYRYDIPSYLSLLTEEIHKEVIND